MSVFKKHIIFLLFVLYIPLAVSNQGNTYRQRVLSDLKILHISFHRGCINDFKEVCNHFGWQLTSWYILSSALPRDHLDGFSRGNEVYNIGHDRADIIWKRFKTFFNRFDVVVTSDTAPLARVFLQNDWKKPLIIWVCNRFDYCNKGSLDCDFPDQEYYDLIKKAYHQKNVQIISSTEYDWLYARAKGVDIGTNVIRTIGTKEKNVGANIVSYIPRDIRKNETIFIYPRLYKRLLYSVQDNLQNLGIKAYSGAYNGPDDIKDFKGVIYFPYQVFNVALCENIQRGIVHFVPSKKFIYDRLEKQEPVLWCKCGNFELCDWYKKEFKDCMVYFDSWQDLRYKIEHTNYQLLRKRIKAIAQRNEKVMLSRWKKVFTNAASFYTCNF